MKEPRKQFEFFDFNETHNINDDSVLRMIDQLEAEAGQKNNSDFGIENEPFFCDTDWYFQKRGRKK